MSIPRSYFDSFFIFAYTFGGCVWCGATLDISKFNGNKIGKIFNLKKFAWIEKWKKKSDGKKMIFLPPLPLTLFLAYISCLLCGPFANIIFYSPQLAHILSIEFNYFIFPLINEKKSSPWKFLKVLLVFFLFKRIFCIHSNDICQFHQIKKLFVRVFYLPLDFSSCKNLNSEVSQTKFFISLTNI